MATTKRKDKARVVLKTGEVQRKDGTYQYSWTEIIKEDMYMQGLWMNFDIKRSR